MGAKPKRRSGQGHASAGLVGSIADRAPDLPVVVVGAGPCGIAAAAALEEAGMHAVVFDRGCLVSSIAAYPIYMTFFSTADRIAIADVPFRVESEKPTRREALAYYRGVVDARGIEVHQYEPVVQVWRRKGDFIVHSKPLGGDVVETKARAVVVATGYLARPTPSACPARTCRTSRTFITRGTRPSSATRSSSAAATRRPRRRSTCSGTARR